MVNSDQHKGSTDQVTATAFRPHGRIDIWMEQDVLYYEATGPFNEELFVCLAVAQKNFLNDLQPTGPWASIGIFVSNALTTPEGIARYTQIMQTPRTPALTPVATAFVIGAEVVGGSIMAPHLKKLFAAIERPMRICTNLGDAQQWVHAMLAPSTTASAGL
jgi:hypothetical protein